jgi:hypothetical protein
MPIEDGILFMLGRRFPYVVASRVLPSLTNRYTKFIGFCGFLHGSGGMVK